MCDTAQIWWQQKFYSVLGSVKCPNPEKNILQLYMRPEEQACPWFVLFICLA